MSTVRFPACPPSRAAHDPAALTRARPIGRIPQPRRAVAAYIRRGIVEFAQYGLLVAGWTVAFLLGKELQGGFAQWRDRRR